MLQKIRVSVQTQSEIIQRVKSSTAEQKIDGVKKKMLLKNNDNLYHLEYKRCFQIAREKSLLLADKIVRESTGNKKRLPLSKSVGKKKKKLSGILSSFFSNRNVFYLNRSVRFFFSFLKKKRKIAKLVKTVKKWSITD